MPVSYNSVGGKLVNNSAYISFERLVRCYQYWRCYVTADGQCCKSVTATLHVGKCKRSYLCQLIPPLRRSFITVRTRAYDIHQKVTPDGVSPIVEAITSPVTSQRLTNILSGCAKPAVVGLTGWLQVTGTPPCQHRAPDGSLFISIWMMTPAFSMMGQPQETRHCDA